MIDAAIDAAKDAPCDRCGDLDVDCLSCGGRNTAPVVALNVPPNDEPRPEAPHGAAAPKEN